MFKFPLGVMSHHFKLPERETVETAAKLGVQGIQLLCTYGEYAPENMTRDKINNLMDIMKSNGLIFSAICGDLGCGFADSEHNDERIETSKRIMDLAKELGSDIVTTHIGVVPADKNHERYKIMQEACIKLAEYADSIGSHFAVETGPETAVVLKGFLDSLNSHGVAVNLDPANFVMVTGDDPAQAVYTLKDYIVHTHAKDGIKLKDCNPEVVYGIIEEEIQSGTTFKEVPLGEGQVDWDKYLKALCDIGYKGFLTIEREVHGDVVRDVKTAVDFLNAKMAE